MSPLDFKELPMGYDELSSHSLFPSFSMLSIEVQAASKEIQETHIGAHLCLNELLLHR
jgi:hypothetical protein